MAGKLPRSTDLRAPEIEVSSGGCRTGQATSSASTRAAKPVAARPQTTALRPPDTILLITTRCLLGEHNRDCIEYSVLQINRFSLVDVDDRCRREHHSCTTVRKGRFHTRHDRSRSPYQRTGIHGVRTVLRPETDGGGCLWPCPGARRNLGFPRAALLRALLLRAEGRERQDRGGDLEGRP